MAITVLNNASDLSGKTLVKLEDAQTVTGVKNFINGLQTPGIVFPASQIPVTNPNTLDDYEEFPWVPTINSSGGQSGVSYTNQEGVGVKIGRFVFVSCLVRLAAGTFSAGNVIIGGLPFVAEVGLLQTYQGGSVTWSDLNTPFVSMGCAVRQNTTTIEITALAAAATGSFAQLQASALGANAQFRVSVFYRAVS